MRQPRRGSVHPRTSHIPPRSSRRPLAGSARRTRRDSITTAFDGDHPGHRRLPSHVRVTPSTLRWATTPLPSAQARLSCAGTGRSRAAAEPFPKGLPSPRARRYGSDERYARQYSHCGGCDAASAGVGRYRRRWRSTASCSPRRWWVAGWRRIQPTRRPGMRERGPADGQLWRRAHLRHRGASCRPPLAVWRRLVAAQARRGDAVRLGGGGGGVGGSRAGGRPLFGLRAESGVNGGWSRTPDRGVSCVLVGAAGASHAGR